MARVIVHIDLNAFFASVEEIKNPSLKNKPIAVGGKGRRGVVSTSNYVARKYGVHSAMPIAMALKLCPNLIIVEESRSDYIKYSEKFFSIIKEFMGEKIEVASIDECYVDFSDYKSKCDNPIEYLKNMQKYIYEKLGLGCSIGISYNKFLAKMGSDMKKPLGFTVIRSKDVRTLIWPLKINDMFGIGKKTAPKLIENGIKTIKDLAICQDTYMLKNILGKNYIHYINFANGVDNSEVVYIPVDAKSIGNSTTYENNLEMEEEILATSIFSPINSLIIEKNFSEYLI